MDNIVHVLILQSMIGDAERKLQWDVFSSRFAKETSFTLQIVTNPDEADFVFLATGGVEQFYVDRCDEMPRAIYAPPMTNAFAAMNEIRGYLSKHHENAFCFDETSISLDEFVRIARSRRLINQARIAVFGAPAPWLVASYPSRDQLRSRFKTAVTHASWDELNWLSHSPDISLIEIWRKYHRISVDDGDFMRACQLSSSMIEWTKRNQVDGITVGCFPLLSQHVSACLAVSDLLDAGYAAACENDICSVMAMMTAMYLGLCTQPPWMANIVDIRGDVITLQHCTIAKTGLESCDLMTHFESDANVGVAGKLKADLPVTVFRFNEDFDKACIIEGKIVDSGPNKFGCRTSATIQLAKSFSVPLGNHHILIIDHVGHILREFCKMMNIGCER